LDRTVKASSDHTPVRPSESIPLSNEAATREILAQSMLGLWNVVNQLSRLRPTRRERYRVSIFGSARVDPGHWAYAAVRDVAAELTRMGCDIVTGGGPGLMQAANEGARLADPESKQESVGIRIALPFEQNVNAFVSDAYEHETFFTRLHHFVLVSDAFVVVPGGIGTVLETMMIWQLLQVRKLNDSPLILVGPMWQGLIEWSRSAMLRSECPLASPEDFEIPKCVTDGQAAIDQLRIYHAAWRAKSAG